MNPTGCLTTQAQDLGVCITDAQAEQLLLFLNLLAKWNKVHNLTAVRDVDKMLTHHILDSLSVAQHVRAPSLLDVGSGAGLPGIPLAIADPLQSITLIDSNKKKISFLRQAVMELGLKNVHVIAGRVEALAPKQTFDGIISRAFSEINQFIALTRPLLAKDGYWYAMKGLYPTAELQQLPNGIALQSVQALNVPLLDAQRHLVILKEANG